MEYRVNPRASVEAYAGQKGLGQRSLGPILIQN